MKQSVDLNHSMTLMKKRHNNTISSSVSLARRALMVLTILTLSVANTWGQLTATNITDASLVHSWSGPQAGATDNGATGGAVCNLNTSVECAYGDGNVYYLNYADLSEYKYLKLVVKEGTVRLLFNRVADQGDLMEINPNNENFSKYVISQNSIWYVDLEKIGLNEGGYVHLNAIKAPYLQNINIKSITLYNYPVELSTTHFNNTAAILVTGSEVGNQGVIYGWPDGRITETDYADLTSYSKLVIAYSGNTPRLIFNQVTSTDRIELNAEGDYVTLENGMMTIDLAKLKSDKGAVRLNSIKAWGGSTTVFAAHLYTAEEYNTTNFFEMGNEAGCETHVYYQLDGSETEFNVDLAQFKEKILQHYGKNSLSELGTGENRFYLRWYVVDNTTNKYLPVQDEILSAVGSSAGTHYLEDVGMLWFGGPTDANFADAINVHVKLPTGYTRSNVTLVCVTTEDVHDIWPRHEPVNLQHKYLIRFIGDWSAQHNGNLTLTDANSSETFSTRLKVEQGATATAPGTAPALGQLQAALVELYNQAFASTTSLNNVAPRYVRVYLTNSSGTMINAAKSDNWTLYFSQASGDGIQNKISKGYVWAKSDAQTWLTFSATNVFNTILTKPDGFDWTNVKVVCDLTDDLTGSYFVGNGIMEEPTNLKARLIVSFKEDNGDDYSATTSELTTGTTILRKHNSTETASLDLATSEHFSDVNAKFDNHLNDNTTVSKFYIRWYLADEDGEWIPTPAGISLSPVYTGYADKIVGEKNYGKVLYLGNAGATVTADMLRMNVTVANADVDMNDYQVVCALGYAEEGYTTEPSPLKVKYIYNFKSPFEGKLAADAIEHTKEVIVTRDDQTAGYVTIPIDDYYSEILSDYNTNATDLGQSLHVRWYVVYNGEQYRRSDLQLEAANSTAGYKYYNGSNDTEGYLYWNSATSGTTATEGKLNIKFTVPTTDTHWENYKVVAVLSNNISAENGQEVSGTDLVREPQILNVKYTFSLIDGVFKFVHYRGASGRDYFTHSDDVNINAPSGEFSFTQTTVFLPTEANVIGGRGDGFFTSDRYTLGTAKESDINPSTGEAAPEGAKYGGLTVKKDNPTKTATFKVTGVNSVVAYVVSTNKTESRTCHATVRTTDNSSSWSVDGTSAAEGQTAVINISLDPNQEYVIDFSDCRKTGTDDGADMSLLGVRFVVGETAAHLYTPTQYTQYSWDNESSKVVTAERGDIRQGVHTVDYQVFISPNEINDNKKILKLPFEAYEGTAGNNLEPMAYIRWYDWSSDLGSSHLTKVGTWLKQLNDDAGNRGFFMLNNSVSGLKPTQARVGVTYDPTNLTTDGDIIACDVSKYYDGLYPGLEADDRADFSGKMYPQLVHEPTLSTRYLFHIYPSSVIAEKILTGHNALQTGINSLNGGSAYTRDLKTSMFNNIYEENGRVVVSLNGSAGTFAVRADLYSLTNYYINGGWTQCNHISWYAYLEDERGLWERNEGAVAGAYNRIQLLELSNLNGSYRLLSNNSTTKSVTAAPGMRFHLVGFVNGYENGNPTTNEQAAIHYELQFLDAPAIMAENLASTNVKRTTAYLEQNFRRGGVVNFDNYFEDLSEPTTEAKNMLFNPIPWKEAEYGFCYPTIDKYRIRTGWSGITPIHGDYMLVKSMLRPNVSAKGDDSGEVPAAGCEYAYHWYTYDPTILYDYTHLVKNSEYGGYIYVDASDESRTIATLDFNANLCAGSQIYFTAAIADVTSGDLTSPQLMAHVYANNEFGEKTLVISFLTSVLRGVNTGDGGTYKQNHWYQVYGHGNIPENIDISNYTDFSVVIDNYSKDTNGADFCVDEIRFYTSTGKMQVEQTGGKCVDEELKVTAFMDEEHLEALITLGDTSRPIYYRIYKKTGTDANGKIKYEPCTDPILYNNEGKSYGVVQAYKCVVDENGALDATDSKNAHYFVRDNIIYFKLLDDQVLNLPIGEEYYVATTENLEYPNPDGDLNDWANPNDPCDAYSNFFVPRRYYIYFLDQDGNQADQTIVGKCDDGASNVINYTTVVNAPNDNEPTGFLALPAGEQGVNSATNGVLFDFFVGTVDDIKTGGEYDGLFDALRAYRQYETDGDMPYKDYLHGDFAYYNAGYYNVLKRAIDNNRLFLVADSKFDNGGSPIYNTTNFLAIPVKEVYNVNGTEYHLCDYMPFTITIDGTGGMPTLTLGFDDVDYTTAGVKRVVRVGLEQLNKMRTQSYKLHIPVSGYADKHHVMTKRLYFPSESYLILSTTNDPTQTSGEGTSKFAKLVPIGSEERPWVDKDHMYLVLDLSGDNCAIDFHEGYQYEVATTYMDEEDENRAYPCIGDMFLVIKVVPEFVTWYAQNVDNDGKPTTSNTGFHSANWYNDGNWLRSVRSELYKDVNNSDAQQNTPTKGHPNGYDNNGEGSLSGLSSSSNPGFVPMKFTYVILPSGNNAPSLINEPRVTGEGVGSRRQGGGFLKLGDGDDETWLLTDRSPRDPDGTPKAQRTNSKPTENIYYDMMVRYSYSDTDPFGEGCFGHRYIKNDGTWDDQGDPNMTAKVFDVEKFQGNICREIYFKPGAELLRQQRLTYEKAWVEMELDANKWYLLASPMQCTYAGDMYVPYANGRQETEAFQPINFTDTKGSTALYSRTKYPIYQRSWGMNNGNVYVKENDIRANYYSANLKYATVTTNLVEWGHTFNDVQVPYHTSENTLSQNLAGFSIRAHKKVQPNKTLIRLPKADTDYYYYDWDNNKDTGSKTTVSKLNYAFQLDDGTNTNTMVTLFTVPYSYRLVTDEHQRDGDLEYSISAMQQNGDYVLVGNPYMVSIDMKKFFDTNNNSDLGIDQTGYWTYEASTAVAHTKPTTVCTDIIKPMQGFFVKKGTASKIIFNRDMQVDGNFPPPAPSGSARQLVILLSAANSRGGSSANVELDDNTSAEYVEGEDVETLFDSNLADVPMVYTVAADGMAVSIDTRPTLDVVPFGVTCNSNEPVDVGFEISNLKSQISNLYVFDALTGATKAVNDGESVSIQPNDYGRYYLTTNEKIGNKVESLAADGIVISVRNGEVTVTSNSPIGHVHAVSMSGATVYEQANCGTTTQFQLQTGTYVIEVEGNVGKRTTKILVK